MGLFNGITCPMCYSSRTQNLGGEYRCKACLYKWQPKCCSSAEIDLLDAVAPAFKAGRGTLILGDGMPDQAILLAIKEAMAHGMPFIVIPSPSKAPGATDTVVRVGERPAPT